MAQPYNENQLADAAAIFRALSDPERLRTLTLLAEQPLSVGRLAEQMGQRIGTVSARLKVLLQARLVSRRRQGQSALYSIADQHVFQLIANALDHAGEDPVTHSNPRRLRPATQEGSP